MQAEETKMILRYFGGIEAQLDDVNIELAELRDRYNPIKGIAMDGMPHGSTPGDSASAGKMNFVFGRMFSVRIRQQSGGN